MAPMLKSAEMLLFVILVAAADRTAGMDGCQSQARHSLTPLHSGTCVEDSDLQRQLRLPDAQLMTGAADLQSCMLACASHPTLCAVAQFHFGARVCHMTTELPRVASEAEAATTATRGDCVTTFLRRDASGTTGWQFAARLAAFFDFRISDRNLGTVGAGSLLSAPAQFAGTTIRNASGAVLPGKLDSFVKIPVDGPGFQAFASPTREYTFFLSIMGLPSVPSGNLHLLRVVPSTDPLSEFCSFVFFDGTNLKFTNFFTQTIGYRTDSSMPLLPQQKFFVGVTYNNASTVSSAIFNGTVYPVSQYNTYTLGTDLVFDEIKLGAEGTVEAVSLKGTILCFAFAPVALTAEEFHALGSVC